MTDDVSVEVSKKPYLWPTSSAAFTHDDMRALAADIVSEAAKEPPGRNGNATIVVEWPHRGQADFTVHDAQARLLLTERILKMEPEEALAHLRNVAAAVYGDDERLNIRAGLLRSSDIHGLTLMFAPRGEIAPEELFDAGSLAAAEITAVIEAVRASRTDWSKYWNRDRYNCNPEQARKEPILGGVVVFQMDKTTAAASVATVERFHTAVLAAYFKEAAAAAFDVVATPMDRYLSRPGKPAEAALRKVPTYSASRVSADGETYITAARVLDFTARRLGPYYNKETKQIVSTREAAETVEDILL